MVAFQRSGKSYLAIATASATVISIMEYDPLAKDTPVKHTIALGGNGASDLSYAESTGKLYFGRRTATINSTVVSFNEVWSVDLQNVGVAVLPAPVQVASTVGRDCYNLRVTPNGQRILMKCFTETLVDLNTSNGSYQAYSLPVGHDRGDLAIEPSKGTFAYSASTVAPFNIAVLDLAPASLAAGPSTQIIQGPGFGGGLSFHPTGKWAYFWPGNNGSHVGLLETGPGVTPPASGNTMKTAIPFGYLGRTGYDLLVGGDRAYLLSLGNPGYSENFQFMLLAHQIQSDGTLSQIGGVNYLGGTNAGNPQGAIFPVYPLTVNTNLAPNLDPLVGITNFGSSLDQHTNPNIPAGQVNIFAPATQPDPLNAADIEWRFVDWYVDGNPNSTLPTTPSGQVPVDPPGGKIYTANYEKWVRINLQNNGCSVVSISPGFHKANSSPFFHVEAVAGGTIGSPTFVPSIGSITAIPNDTPFAISQPGTIVVTCTTAPPSPTTTILTAVATSIINSSFTMTATVSPNPGSGTVDFYAGITKLNASPIALSTTAKASFAYAGLPLGLHQLKAIYSGIGSTFLQSTSANVPHTVIAVGSAFLAPAAPVSTYASPEGPIHVVAADFNGDKRMDFATLRSNTQGVNVYRGSGKGTFTVMPGSPFSTGSKPYFMAAADLDGDGDQDIVTVQRDVSTVTVLLNNGAGTFTPASGSGFAVSGCSPTSVAAADVTGDGKVDLVMSCYNSGDARVFPGQGGGVYGSPTNWPMGTNSAAVVVGDFNKDGLADIAVANRSSGDVALRLGNGAGGFGAAAAYPAAHGGHSMIASDLNSDGRLDIMVVSTNEFRATLLSNGSSALFSPAVFDYGVTGSWGVSAGDVDGDGDPDLFLPDSTTNKISILLNDGKGVFTPAPYSPLPVGDGPVQSALADFNGDGRLDAVVANLADNSVTVLLGHAPLATVKLAVSCSLVRDTNVIPNEWLATLAVTNLGPTTQTANSVKVTKSNLGSVNTKTSGLALSLGSITGGTTRTTQLRFPLSASLVSNSSYPLTTTISSSSTGTSHFTCIVKLP